MNGQGQLRGVQIMYDLVRLCDEFVQDKITAQQFRHRFRAVLISTDVVQDNDLVKLADIITTYWRV
jgi:DNA-binding protein YbaB